MALTPAQLPALRDAILVETDPAFVAARQINDETAMARFLNAAAAPAFYVWKSSVPTGELFDAIVWANLTPSPVPDGTAAWTNRSLACQGKQFNLQTILTGRESINPSKSRIRNGLQDALTDVPSGNNGNARQAGWTEVLALLYRPATAGEKIFATGAGTDVSPALLAVEGKIGRQDIVQARAQ